MGELVLFPTGGLHIFGKNVILKINRDSKGTNKKAMRSFDCS